MKMPSIKKILLLGAILIATVWCGFYWAGRVKTHASAKSIEFASTDLMAKYNEIDRQQAQYRIQIQVLEQVNKKAIRDSLGVPQNFREKRLDPNSFDSMVTGFEESPTPVAK